MGSLCLSPKSVKNSPRGLDETVDHFIPHRLAPNEPCNFFCCQSEHGRRLLLTFPENCDERCDIRCKSAEKLTCSFLGPRWKIKRIWIEKCDARSRVKLSVHFLQSVFDRENAFVTVTNLF